MLIFHFLPRIAAVRPRIAAVRRIEHTTYK